MENHNFKSQKYDNVFENLLKMMQIYVRMNSQFFVLQSFALGIVKNWSNIFFKYFYRTMYLPAIILVSLKT